MSKSCLQSLRDKIHQGLSGVIQKPTESPTKAPKSTNPIGEGFGNNQGSSAVISTENNVTNNSSNRIIIDQSTFDKITGKSTLSNKVGACKGLNMVIERYKIDTPLRLAHFLAQLCHESCNLSVMVENLNYSKDALLRVFPKYFNSSNVLKYARKPQAIASRVYANRMGNGPESSGDGWTYRGRGYIQLTGKDNYKKYGGLIGADLINNPDRIKDDPITAMLVAGEYWSQNKLNTYADKDDILTITKRINGGTNGLVDRKNQLARIKRIIK